MYGSIWTLVPTSPPPLPLHSNANPPTDLSTLYNWNTKQVFLYIKATYPSTNSTLPPSSAIIWDAILPSPLEPWHQNQYIHPSAPPKPKGNSRVVSRPGITYSRTRRPGILKLSNQKPKYVITDVSGKISEIEGAVLELGWSVQPWVGGLTWNAKGNWGVWKAVRGGVTKAFSFPEVVGKKIDMGTVKGAENNRGKPA